MAGIGVILGSYSVADGDNVIYLDVSSVTDQVASGIRQRVYGDGQQRAIAGYAERSSLRVTCQRVDKATYDWLAERVGREVVYRDELGTATTVTVGDLRRTRETAKSDEYSWNVQVDFYLTAVGVGQGLPAAVGNTR